MRSHENSDDETPATVVKDNESLRCCCGSLLARVISGGVEVKCRRCKRRVLIPLSHDAESKW